MPYEQGGRADKFGNRYEYRWVAMQLLRLCNEKISSLVHEPIGEIEDGVDILIYDLDGSIELHQCKGRNANKDKWSISDLNAREIFPRIKKHLDSGKKFQYKFVSPLSCQAMETLIQRAKNSPDNPIDFYQYQIKPSENRNAPQIEKDFLSFLKCMGLTPISECNLAAAIGYLSRIEFITIPDTEYQRMTIIERLSDIFSADPEMVYNILVNYTTENDRLGHNVTIAEMNSYLDNRQIYKFDLSNHEQMWPRISTLNEEFESSFVPLDFGLIQRKETERIYSMILDNKSIIIHGKAGSGKSGCIQELGQLLNEVNIPYLALKLDKRIPEKSAKQYGMETLGLPASPVLCLSQLASSGNSVLILDQLDAIRWTSQHTRTALDVCKELINQVERVNSDPYIKSKISIIFVCRTVDIETDNGIKSLFNTDDRHRIRTQWEKVKVGDLDEETVKLIIGEPYASFTPKFKDLLKNINNLYIWSKLNDERKRIQYASTYHLIQGYWEQFEQKCEGLGIIHNEIYTLKKLLVNGMLNVSRTAIPKSMLRRCSSQVRNMAISEGIIIENDLLVFFVHQSFYDVFVVETMVEEIYIGVPIESILGSPDKQTPTLRYRLQMLLQILSENDQCILVQCGKALLQNPNIRYYMKYVFWEVVGQLTKVDSILMDLIVAYIQSLDWFYPIVNTVIAGHPYYVSYFIENGLISSWISSEKIDTALGILRSVNTVMGDQIVEAMRSFAFKSVDTDIKIYRTLSFDIDDDSDTMFDLRIQIVRGNPELLNEYINFKALAKKDLQKAFDLLKTIIEVNDHVAGENIGKYVDSDFNVFEHIGKELSEHVWNTFMPLIERKTSGADSIWSPELRGWSDLDVHPEVGRGIVKMAITAGENLAMSQPAKFIAYLSIYSSLSLVINEILLYSSIMLPANFSDDIVNWLISDSCSHIFDETGKHEKRLDAAKLLIEKYSKTCSDDIFAKLEEAILNYHDEYELERAKRRFEHNQAVRREDYNQHPDDSFEAYWPYWGELQAYLLPALDASRTSVKTKQLICVLNRRFAGFKLGGTKSRIVSGWGGTSIPQKNSRVFSDRQWLRLIKNEKLSSKEFLKKASRRFGFSESSHESFARLYEHAGKANPKRFVSLASKFPVDVDRHYVQAVWSIASEMKAPNDAENWQPATFDCVKSSVELFLDHPEKDEMNMCMSLCRLVRDRVSEDWPVEAINRIISLALYYEEADKGVNDEKNLEMYSLNCVRGSATHALSHLLWERYDRYALFKPVIAKLVQDENPAVRHAILEAVIATFNIDKGQSEKWLFALVNSDERIARSHRALDMLFRLWPKYKDECNTIIQNLFYSKDEKSSESGAFMATNLYIVFDEGVGPLKDMIFSGILSENQIKGCSRVSIELMEELSLHDKAKSVIEELVKYSEKSKNSLNVLFYRSKFVLPQDIELIKKMVTLSPNESFMALRHYIEKNDISVLDFADIILHLCDQYINNENIDGLRKGGYYSIVNEFPVLVAALYDQANGDYALCNKCLDMWDILYQSNMGNSRLLTQQIMDY